MRNPLPVRFSHSAVATCALLCCVMAMSEANPSYSSRSASGNLQEQCKEFNAAVVANTSFTVSAVCNDTGGAHELLSALWNDPRSTSFDLSGDVRWDTVEHALSWDTTASGSNQDISAKCKPGSASPFTVTATDVTLALSCLIQTYGAPERQDVSLGLNTNLKAGTDGTLSRR